MLWIKRVITSLITLMSTWRVGAMGLLGCLMSTLIPLIRMTRRIAAAGLLGCLMLAFLPVGCASRLGPITASQSRQDGKAPVPAVTVERLKACMEVYGEQLGPGSHRINPVIKADKNGVKWSVTENDIPNSAAEFGSCTRQALRDMEIPAEFFKLAEVMQQRAKGDVSKAQRSNMGSPLILVVGVAIGLSELMLEAGAYTILFAISVELVHEAAKDIEDAIDDSDEKKQQCNAELTACLLTPLADEEGNVIGSSRCVMCWGGCIANNGVWPYRMMKGKRWASCEYK